MAMDWTFINQMFTSIEFNGSTIVIPLIIVALSVILITRDIDQMKVLFFPITMLWFIVGIDISPVFMTITAIQFVFSAIGVKIVGRTLQSFKQDKPTIIRKTQNITNIQTPREKE